MSVKERRKHAAKQRKARAKKNGGGRGAAETTASAAAKPAALAGRVDATVWASMSVKDRRKHAAKQRKARAKTNKKGRGAAAAAAKPAAASSKSRQRRRPAQKTKRAWRFAVRDRVRCKTGDGDATWWVSGRVQALNVEHCGVLLPYVVVLDVPPVGNETGQIAVPTDGSHCLRADVCFAEGAEGGPCAKSIARSVPTQRARGAKLRFAVGDRVACLTAGKDGAGWPRRWSAGTITAQWHVPMGAGGKEGAVVPYAVTLDAAAAVGGADAAAIRRGTAAPAKPVEPTIVLAHVDDHQYVRSLALQPAGAALTLQCLTRFTERMNVEKGWVEDVDQQTLRARQQDSDSDDSSSDEEEEAAAAAAAPRRRRGHNRHGHHHGHHHGHDHTHSHDHDRSDDVKATRTASKRAARGGGGIAKRGGGVRTKAEGYAAVEARNREAMLATRTVDSATEPPTVEASEEVKLGFCATHKAMFTSAACPQCKTAAA